MSKRSHTNGTLRGNGDIALHCKCWALHARPVLPCAVRVLALNAVRTQ